MLRLCWMGIFSLLVLCGLSYDSSREANLLIQYARQGLDANSNWALLVKIAPDIALPHLTETDAVYWLTIAAKANYVQAQYRLALRHPDQQIARFWLLEAAQNGYVAAQLDLYRQLADTEPRQALDWLQQAAARDADSALILASIKWQKGDYAEAEKYLKQAQTMGSEKATLYRQAIADNRLGAIYAASCRQQLLPVTTSLAGLLQAYQFKQTFRVDPSFVDLPICFGNTRIFTAQQFQCDANWNGLPRLGCDEDFLAQQLQDDDFTHLIVFASQGKANVNNGIMYLDQHDSYQVFIHELAHFAGFVDEYPLSGRLAEKICSPTRQSPNIVIEKRQATSTIPQSWRGIEREQLVKARTCDNTPFQAYKPISAFTFMEFYDEGIMPALYMSLWKQQLATTVGILPAYINLAQAAQASGNKALSAFWWQRYQNFQR